MFITLQFPLADKRRFLEIDTGQLSAPPWPLADPNRHFIRSVGPIRRRRRGFPGGWPGEGLLCNAKGAFKFVPPDDCAEAERQLLTPAFRRYYAGGNSRWAGAVARIDTGFQVAEKAFRELQPRGRVRVNHFQELARSCLALRVVVPGQENGRRELVTAGPALAQRLLQVTTNTKYPAADMCDWWIEAGTPLILIEAAYQPYFSASLDALERAWISADRDADPVAAHYLSQVEHRGYTVPVWIVLHDPAADPGVLRNLRIHLWRLHNEREVLKLVLASCIIERRLSPAGSETLRDYLAKQSDRLRKSRSEGFTQRNLIDYAYRLDNLVNEDDIPTLKELLDSIGPGMSASVMPIAVPVRQDAPGVFQIKNAVFLENGNMIVEDNSQIIGNVENAGAIVGGKAKVSGGNFQGSGTQLVGSLSDADLAQLTKELSSLRAELRSRATEVEQDQAVGALATAEQAAGEGDRTALVNALKTLRKAGGWVLSVAKEIGVSLAAEVIKSSLGI